LIPLGKGTQKIIKNTPSTRRRDVQAKLAFREKGGCTTNRNHSLTSNSVVYCQRNAAKNNIKKKFP